ncbi:MAG TPA: NAD(P)/FAD-dependent oxidoreductase [Actinomycetota bacterium]|nr:NAD(P)/FAD-dependent oxidoreductase [Actinomycetota bacterium]
MSKQVALAPPGGTAGGSWDVIVVGARVAGSATALQLARKGYRVLLVDRNWFPSDTLSTHVIQLSGLKVLAELGLLDAVKATGAPPITRFRLQAGPVTLAGSPVPAGSISETLCVRRTRLDTVLVEAARRAGAELREHFAFLDVVTSGSTVKGIRARSVDGRQLIERARLVVGADGKHSSVARAVGAGAYETIPARSCCFYSYWSDLDLERDEGRLYLLDRRTLSFFPTNDGLTMVGLQAPSADFKAVRSDVEGSFLAAAQGVPGLAEKLRAGRRVEHFRGTPELDAFFREPFGAGWALVGDAGCHRDPITAQGISAALRDSVFLAEALDDHLTGKVSWDQAGQEYRRRRDWAEMARYHWTADTAVMDRPPAPETVALLQALAGRPRDVSRFFGVFAGTVSVEEFFSPDSVAQLLSGEAA